MRHALAALMFVGCVVGATALAQGLNGPPIVWDRMPEGSIEPFYPSRALQRGEQGLAIVCCTVNERRRLDCTTAHQWPANGDFGEATVRMMRDYRMSQASYDGLRAGGNMAIMQTMRWSMPDARRQPEFDAALTEFSQLAQTFTCPVVAPESAAAP